jgi:zinc D-Ala-D-Ala dipeptidase
VKRTEERAYWTRTLTEGAAFMRAAGAHPVEECGESLADLPATARSAGVRIAFPERHATGRPLDLRLRRSNAEALLGVAEQLAADGALLVVEDALRSPADQAGLARNPAELAKVAAVLDRYELAPGDDELVGWLGLMVAATPRTAGHVAGAAVDVSVRRADGSEIDRGATYPDWSERMPMHSPYVTREQAAARALVNDAMAAHGFVALPYEFWHYSRGDAVAATASGERAPARYGPVHVAPSGEIAPIEGAERFNDVETLVRIVREARAATAPERA